MAALTAARNTKEYSIDAVPKQYVYPVKGTTKILQGGLVGLLAGFLVPASANSAIKVIGRAQKTVDNTAGADGALTCEVQRGAFFYDSGTAADAITAANVGFDCYAIDDHTVGLTDSLGTRPRAGKIVGFDSTLGVIVETGFIADGGAASGLKGELSFPIDLVGIAGTQNVLTLPAMKFAGRILSAYFEVNKPVTTAAKAATLTPKINGTAVTGAALALTSANCTPMGASVAANSSALDTFVVGDVITVDASAVTAFAEGTGSLHLVLG